MYQGKLGTSEVLEESRKGFGLGWAMVLVLSEYIKCNSHNLTICSWIISLQCLIYFIYHKKKKNKFMSLA